MVHLQGGQSGLGHLGEDRIRHKTALAGRGAWVGSHRDPAGSTHQATGLDRVQCPVDDVVGGTGSEWPGEGGITVGEGPGRDEGVGDVGSADRVGAGGLDDDVLPGDRVVLAEALDHPLGTGVP